EASRLARGLKLLKGACSRPDGTRASRYAPRAVLVAMPRVSGWDDRGRAAQLPSCEGPRAAPAAPAFSRPRWTTTATVRSRRADGARPPASQREQWDRLMYGGGATIGSRFAGTFGESAGSSP